MFKSDCSIIRFFRGIGFSLVCLGGLSGFLLPDGGCLQAAPQEHGTVFDFGLENLDVARQLYAANHAAYRKYTDFMQSERGDIEAAWKDYSVDFSGRNLRGSSIHSSYHQLRNLNFDNTDLSDSYMEETFFSNCTFRGAKIRNVVLDASKTCDFTNADISASQLYLSESQLLSTLNYKQKNLSNIELTVVAENVDFSGFDMRHSIFMRSKFSNCDFTDANISHSWVAIDADQLRATYNYKRKDLSHIHLQGDLTGVSFEGFDLRGTTFSGTVTGCNFTDANITGAVFRGSVKPPGQDLLVPGPSITTEQLYSTLSYKERNLGGTTYRSCQLQGFDFSGQRLGYFVDCDLENAKFDGATFSARNALNREDMSSSCGFYVNHNFTFEQLSSTRTFKINRLPEDFEFSKEFRKRYTEERTIRQER